LSGVFLEDNLDTSKRFFDVVLKSFLKGTPGVPALGMHQIPAQLAKQLPAGSIHLNTTVTGVGRGIVRTNHGDIAARSIVLAVNARSAATLISSIIAPPSFGCTTWYHVADCAPQDLTNGESIVVVDGKRHSSSRVDPSRPLVNTAVLTHAAPGYASGSRVLVSSTALGVHDSVATESMVRSHLASLYAVPTSGWTHAATYLVPDALPAMLPPHKPRTDMRLGDGLYVAGDYTDWSSINGAFVSGRRAATALLEDDL
jgi:glycine/D-amino acid oxidase-like deaminating enzyme